MQVGQKRKRRVKDQVRELVANFFHLSEGQEVDAYLNLGLGRSSDTVEEEPSQDFTALLQAFEDSNLKGRDAVPQEEKDPLDRRREISNVRLRPGFSGEK